MILKSMGKAGFDTEAVKFGQGLFETMLYKDGHIVFLNQHIKRIFHSSEILDIGQNHIAGLINDLLSLDNLPESDCIIRISLYDCGYAIETRELPYDKDVYIKGFKICSYPYRRGEDPLFRYKTTSYLSNIYAKKYARERGFDDALICAMDNEILECSYSNIFCRKGNEFFFVDEKSSFLEGISSQNIAEALKILSFTIIKKDITIDFLKSADNVFISNSAMNMMSVGRVDETEFVKDTDMCFKINEMLLEMDKICTGRNDEIDEDIPSRTSSDYRETDKEMNIEIIMEHIKEKYSIGNGFLFSFLTGSSRDLLFSKDKDIDFFIIDEMSDVQIRETVMLYGYELDINILSEKLVNRLIDQNEGFMIKALKNSTYIYGNYNVYKDYKIKILNNPV